MNNGSSLQDLVLDPLSLGIGFGAGCALAAMLFVFRLAVAAKEKAALEARLESERDTLGDHFKVLAQAALQSNNENFLALAGERLKAAQKDGEHDLQKRSIAIEQMVKPVEAHLQRMNGMVEALNATDKTIRDDLQNLHKETSKLTSALRNPAAQGKWGEFVLETILEKANLIKGTHYETQTGIEGGGRPDVIINLHDGFKIAIDSKAPINDFIARLDEDLSEGEAQDIKTTMAATVRGHVKKLGERAYQENIKSFDFVILFLPSESVFSATLNADPSIVDYASDKKVVIASPTLIMSLLRVVRFSWRQVEMAANVAEISALGADLHKRLFTFMEHFARIGKGLGGAVQSYEKALGSMNRMVMPAAQKFQKLHSKTQGTPFPVVPSLESQILPGNDDDIIDYEDDKISHG